MNEVEGVALKKAIGETEKLRVKTAIHFKSFYKRCREKSE